MEQLSFLVRDGCVFFFRLCLPRQSFKCWLASISFVRCNFLASMEHARIMAQKVGGTCRVKKGTKLGLDGESLLLKYGKKEWL